MNQMQTWSLGRSINSASDPLFSGLRLRWQVLTNAERVVCLGIVLTPLWWLWGWNYLILFLAVGIAIYSFRTQGGFQLNRPGAHVYLLWLSGTYLLIQQFFYGSITGIAVLDPRTIVLAISNVYGTGFILWYVQDRKVVVRPQVVFWSCSVLILQIFCLWAVIFFVKGQSFYMPTRSILGTLTGKGEVFVPGIGNTNFLLPYLPEDRSIAGFVRYVFFFHGPESSALVMGFIALLALDIQQRTWKWTLLGFSLFFLLLTGTRSVWLSLPMVFMLRSLMVAGRGWGPWVVCALIACMSFTTLSLPSATNFIEDMTNNTASNTANFRGDSTEVRGMIYRRTWEEFTEASEVTMLLGHVETGEGVAPGYAPAVVGSHSFYLGSLLYRRGIVGSAIFLGYWGCLIQWFFRTRRGRPLSTILVFALFSFTFCVMEMETVVTPLIMLCSTVRESPKPDRPELSRKLSWEI
jgi:hypothetical protein